MRQCFGMSIDKLRMQLKQRLLLCSQCVAKQQMEITKGLWTATRQSLGDDELTEVDSLMRTGRFSNVSLHLFADEDLVKWLELYERYLVDPASSHMLVSKIKPCMSKYKQFIQWNCEWLIKSVIVYLIFLTTWITVVILELIHARKPRPLEGVYLLDKKPMPIYWLSGDS